MFLEGEEEREEVEVREGKMRKKRVAI